MTYFRGQQNLTMQKQCTVCLYGHFHGDLFLRISFSDKNKLFAKINGFTLNGWKTSFTVMYK